MKKKFFITVIPGGLLEFMDGTLRRSRPPTKRTDYSPGFFDCRYCKKEDSLKYKVIQGGFSYWFCSHNCAELYILNNTGKK